MRRFCFPCSPASAASHLDEKAELPPNSEPIVTAQGDDFRILGKPSASEYAGETAKEFLKILQEVAQEIPVPGVGTAVKIAANLIQACEDSHATLERAEELKLRIKTLVTVLVNDLKEKKAEEIHGKLVEHIRSLEKDLTYIQTKLNEIASQNTLLVVFFRSFNEEKVRKCVDRLNDSLEHFNLARVIDHANMLDHLEKQIRTFHTTQQQSLDNIQATMVEVKTTMDDVKAILNSRRPTVSASTPQARSRAVVPANTDIFYGRDALVNDLVQILTTASDGEKCPRVCILGPGGMGKTSTSLAVMGHPDMKSHIPNGRVWVPCVKATSLPLFLDTLYTSLGVTHNTGHTYNDVISELEASEHLVLLLDNFETPWNIDGGRSETERILRDIHQIPHISIFLTMRSSSPPCPGINWHSVDLRAVDLDAARQIYSDVHPAGTSDPDLPALLEAVGSMPLAITLMAKVAKVTGLSAEKLVQKYHKLGTRMLGQGSDAEHSMDVCISLSVDSPPMQRHPEASELLAMLALLPVGTAYDMLETWWACSLANLPGALEVLRETSLVEQQGSTFFVLPVIQRYILDPSHFPDKVRIAMIESACGFLAYHKSSPGDDAYTGHTKAISIEEGNLQAILLDTITATPDSIEALLVLARHQEFTRPRMDVVQHALNLVKGMENNSSQLGDVLVCYGMICCRLNRYNDARAHYTLARSAFLSIPDVKRAAQCLIKLVQAYSLDSGEHGRNPERELIADARSEFESINDRHGVALCLMQLGGLQIRSMGESDAVDLLHQARKTFVEFKDALNVAKCSDTLSQGYSQRDNPEQARTWAMAAVQEYDRIGRHERASELNAQAHSASGDYDSALKLLMQALERSKSYGAPMTTAETLEQIGRIWVKMGRTADAKEAFHECVQMYSSLKGTQYFGATRCRYFVRKLEDPFLKPAKEEWAALARWWPDDIKELVSDEDEEDFARQSDAAEAENESDK